MQYTQARVPAQDEYHGTQDEQNGECDSQVITSFP
jgi:hypothetical protein